MSQPESFYDIIEKDIDGSDVNFTRFRGRVVYGLNVASRCSSTPGEYQRLREIGERFEGRDVDILAFPSGQYANQECTKDAEIADFARTHGPKGLIVMSKGNVKGKEPRPTYAYLRRACEGRLDTSWNFRAKFLVDRTGKSYAASDPEVEINYLLGLGLY